MTVYIDSLFMTNFFMDSVIFFIAGIISLRQTSAVRILAASALSALYGSLMFFPRLGFMYGAALKILISLLLVMLAYGKKRYIKSLISFWAVSAALGGAILALSVFSGFGISMRSTVSNGVIYLNINPLILTVGSVFIYIIMELYKRMNIKNFTASRIRIPLKITYMGRSFNLTGLIDTGCELTEPLGGKPVIIADSAVFGNFIKTVSEISIRTAAGERQLGFIIPDCVECTSDTYSIYRKTPVVLSAASLSSNGLYNAIINPCSLTDEKEGAYQQSNSRRFSYDFKA